MKPTQKQIKDFFSWMGHQSVESKINKLGAKGYSEYMSKMAKKNRKKLSTSKDLTTNS